MSYNDINNRWKNFLAENTFKEDALVSKKSKKKNKNKDKKELITSEEQDISEWEEFQEEKEEDSLEEMSAMSGGAVQGYAGNAFSNKKVKHY